MQPAPQTLLTADGISDTAAPRAAFKAAYRVARLTPRKFACAAAQDAITDYDMFSKALRCWVLRGVNLGGGVAYAKAAAQNGRSFSKAIQIGLRAVKYRKNAACFGRAA